MNAAHNNIHAINLHLFIVTKYNVNICVREEIMHIH